MSDQGSTQPNTAKKSKKKYRTPKKGIKYEGQYYTPKLAKYEMMDQSSVGNVRVVIRKRNQNHTDKTAQHLFDLLSDGKVVSLLSFKKLYQENDELKAIVSKQEKTINRQNRRIGQLCKELEEANLNKIYLNSQITKLGIRNEDLLKQLNGLYEDLQNSMKQNEELVTRIEQLKEIYNALVQKYDDQTKVLQVHQDQLDLKDELLRELRKKSQLDRHLMTEQISQLGAKSQKLAEDNSILYTGFVEQSRVLNDNGTQITQLMSQNELLEKSVMDQDYAINTLTTNNLRLSQDFTVLANTFYVPPLLSGQAKTLITNLRASANPVIAKSMMYSKML